MKKNLLTFIAIISIAFSTHAQIIVSTYAGNGTAALTNGPVAGSQFNQSFGIYTAKNGVIYVADTYNNCVRKIDGGMVTTYAGSSVAGYLDGPALTAKFNQPLCICADDSGNLYVTDFIGQRVRKISAAGIVSTVAGTGIAGYTEGADTVARFNYPRGITIDAIGNLYVADSWNHRIRKVDAVTHEVSSYAGGDPVTGVQTPGGYVDASDTAARFHTPCGVAIDSLGNLYVADAYNHRIRMIDTQRQVTTIAGSGTTGGFSDGAALTGQLNTPTDLYHAANGDILIGDTYNNRVRLLSNGMLSTVAGDGIAGFVNGPALTSEFNHPRGVTANATADSIYVVDGNNFAIRLIVNSTTGINEYGENTVSVFPNPFHDQINVQLSPGNNSCKIILSDIAGKIILEQIIKQSEFKLNTNTIKPGVYLLSIQSSGFILNQKIMKQ